MRHFRVLLHHYPRRCFTPGRAYEIRFPNGDFEVDAAQKHAPPVVGDTLRRAGRLWKVTATTAANGGAPRVVHVQLATDAPTDTR